MDALHYLIIIHKIIIIQYLEITSQAIKYRYLIKSSLSTKFNTNFRRKNTSPVLPWAWVLLYFSLSSDNLGVLFQNKVKSDALRIALWIINFKESLTKTSKFGRSHVFVAPSLFLTSWNLSFHSTFGNKCCLSYFLLGHFKENDLKG